MWYTEDRGREEVRGERKEDCREDVSRYVWSQTPGRTDLICSIPSTDRRRVPLQADLHRSCRPTYVFWGDRGPKGVRRLARRSRRATAVRNVLRLSLTVTDSCGHRRTYWVTIHKTRDIYTHRRRVSLAEVYICSVSENFPLVWTNENR